MTTKESDEIRECVDAGGWDAVRANPRLNAIWQKALREQREYEASLNDG